LVLSITLLAHPEVQWAGEDVPTSERGLAGRDDVLLICDFESDQQWWRAWGARREPVNTKLVQGEQALGGVGRSLQVTVPRGEHTGTSFAFKFRERRGSEPEEIYFRYYLKFDADWKHATSGGKLPGISGTYGRAGWGGRPVNGRDGWSARGLYETRSGGDSTAIGFYCYHADMRGRYGDNWRFEPRLAHGRWYCIEQYCRLNTPGRDGGRGQNDGILRGWIDGKLAFEKTDIRFRDAEALKIEEVWCNVYHGGATPVPEEDIHLYLDNLVIARQPIAPLAAAGSKPDGSTLVVAHKWDDSVGFYDAATGAALQTIPVGKRPHEMVPSRDGAVAYATLYGIDLYTQTDEGGRSIAIVDLQQRAKLGEIDLGKYRRPHGIEVGHHSGRLYVTCDHPAALLVIDPARRAVDAAIELAEPRSLPHMVAVDVEEKTAFVANSGTGTVSVIDLTAQQEVRRIDIGGVPMGLALTADGKTLFATNRTANGVAVIDTAEQRVKRMIEITGQPVRAHLTPDGQWLLVTLIETGELAVVDARALTLERRLTIGQRVEGLTVDAAGRYGYASAQADNKVVKFSLADWKSVLEVKTGTRPDPLIVLSPDR
jgi:YVTN family beta-propeller protein